MPWIPTTATGRVDGAAANSAAGGCSKTCLTRSALRPWTERTLFIPHPPKMHEAIRRTAAQPYLASAARSGDDVEDAEEEQRGDDRERRSRDDLQERVRAQVHARPS